MRNVLIICDNFPPQSGPRMGYLVKYAKRLGWNSYVVAAENKTRNDLTGLSGFAVETHIVPQKPHRKWNLLHMLPFFWPYDYLRGEYEMRRIALDLVKRVKFDLVLLTHTYGYAFINTAWEVAKQAKLPLVIDIRDLMAQNPRLSFFEKTRSQRMDWLRDCCSFISNARAAGIHRKAAALTSISPWHAEWLKRWNQNSVCIYNGFDPELFKPIEPVKADKFEILYTGSLATKRQRNPDLLLRAIKNLSERNIISPETFVVKFYGEPSGSHVKGSAAELGVEKFLEFYPLVPICEVPSLFAKASALLLLAADPGPNGTHGVMTTKFYEYLASGRPVLCVPSDEECLSETLKRTKAGYAPSTVEETTAIVENLFVEWQKHGVTCGNELYESIMCFSRERQAHQFVELFEGVCSKCEMM